MNGQRHIIKRQVIELTIRGSAEARPFQDELSRIYRQRILPLIDQCCSELGRPDRLYRVEALDLDLGTLDVENLEEDLTAKVDAALRRELARQITTQEAAANRPGGGPKTQSQLELFAFFARTGRLPWWAETSRPGLLAENLEHLLRESPEALGRLLRELAREPQPRQRMINHYTDEQLAALCGLLVPVYRQALERDLHELLDGLRSAQITSGHASAQYRQSFWNNLLIVAGIGGGQHTTLDGFYQAILKRVAAELGSTGDGLLSGLHQAIRDGRTTLNSHLSAVIVRLAGADVGNSIPVSETLARRLAQLQAAGGPLAGAWTGLRAILPQLPAWLQAELLALLNKLPADETGQSIASHILRVLEPGAGLQKAPAAENNASEIFRVIQMFRAAAGDFNIPDQAGQESPAEEETVDLSFSETEELFVGNAGLVILWPFLGHFFARLGLLDEERRFKDLRARHRAAGLLQVAATQDASFPEYLLPLNKLLCGLGVTEVFDFGPPLLDSEIRECTDLLEAVIAQAPILHNMSTDSFRGTFLLRPGLLGANNGFWLLRVERQTYDIVLDRFPWSWEWVRLPWMDAPLRVEW